MKSETDAVIAEFADRPGALIAMLQAVQDKFNYLPEEALRQISSSTGIRLVDILGVATFYSQFRLKPAGRHFIRVCIGTACHVKGAERVYDSFRRDLGITGDDDTDSERLFTVEKVACLGCCMLAPAVQIDDVIYGFVQPGRTSTVLRDFIRDSARPGEHHAGSAAGTRKTGEIRICRCSSCSAGGAGKVRQEAEGIIASMKLPVRIKDVGCNGASFEVPAVDVTDASGKLFRYGRVQEEDVRGILMRHFIPVGTAARIGAGVYSMLEQLVTGGGPDESVTRYPASVRDAGCGAQKYIAMDRAGELSPLDINDYISGGGFEALAACTGRLMPEGVIEEIRLSGLRGRGGAGFPTSRKWDSVFRAVSDEKFVICNGDEGDPGAFMDRMILESFPFRVIEGLAIAGLAVGAEKAFVYVRAEYPLALSRIRDAVRICRERGIFGPSSEGKTGRFDIEVTAGAGAFVCGEETALIEALEGRRGMPRFRPPYPAERGLYGKPTLVNNVETLALVPWIIRNGANTFAELGTELSKGTKTFALAGRIVRGGLIEVPMGITISEIVHKTGGGIEDGGKFKAVLIGGPSGGCIPASLEDTPVDYESLTDKGAMMGSGGMVVLDETDCMVDIARYFLEFTQRESCGKCTFCRTGTKHMLDILQRLCSGKGRQEDIDALEALAGSVRKGSLCGLGKTAPNPVLSTLKYFRSEYEDHAKGTCPAGRCRNLIAYVINDNCIGCTKCAQVCPVRAIEPSPYSRHKVDAEKCTRCDSCRKVCPSAAVDIISGGRKVERPGGRRAPEQQ